MLLGQALVAENYDDGSGGGVARYPASVYTPWIRRVADAGLFNIDIVFLSPPHTTNGSTPALTMYVETKNLDVPDSSATTAASQEFTSAGVKTLEASGLEELVRLRFTLDDVSGSAPTGRTYNTSFRVLRPSWKKN